MPYKVINLNGMTDPERRSIDQKFLAVQASEIRQNLPKMVEMIEHNVTAPVWWVAVCLDGAPERFRYMGNNTIDVIREENRFKAQVYACMLHQNDPQVLMLPYCRDGVIIAYRNPTVAHYACTCLAQSCRQENEERKLPWNWQFHVRAGIGSTVEKACLALLDAKRDQLCIACERDDYLHVDLL